MIFSKSDDNDIICTLKKNLVITTKRILFSVLVQCLVNITKHNNSNQSFDNNY